jgi:hypothetical protein
MLRKMHGIPMLQAPRGLAQIAYESVQLSGRPADDGKFRLAYWMGLTNFARTRTVNAFKFADLRLRWVTTSGRRTVLDCQ